MSDNAFLDDNGMDQASQERSTPAAGPDASTVTRAAGGPAEAGEAFAGRCPCNTYPQSSPDEVKHNTTHQFAGALDWLEWSSAVQWDRENFAELTGRFDRVKARCQEDKRPFEWIEVEGVGPIRVGRTGGNRGGDRGQHFDYKVSFQDVLVFMAARHDADEKRPNLWVRLTGRDCLLRGATEAYACIGGMVEALGGKAIVGKLSRVDPCLDIPNMDVRELQEAVERGQFITRAGSVEPRWDALYNRKTGFTAGKCPLHLTVYDKVRHLLGREDHLYVQAMIDRRWGGECPEKATRIEFQCSRAWLLENGISSPEDFFRLQGTIVEKLTHDWFRLTDRPVDRGNKNQTRAETLPLWVTIQDAFQQIYGRPAGELAPVQRQKIEPMRLIKQARGCLRNAMLQMGLKCRTHPEFLLHCRTLLEYVSRIERDQIAFVEDYARRETEYLT